MALGVCQVTAVGMHAVLLTVAVPAVPGAHCPMGRILSVWNGN